jgi:hypothetical protein
LRVGRLVWIGRDLSAVSAPDTSYADTSVGARDAIGAGSGTAGPEIREQGAANFANTPRWS